MVVQRLMITFVTFHVDLAEAARATADIPATSFIFTESPRDIVADVSVCDGVSSRCAKGAAH